MEKNNMKGERRMRLNKCLLFYLFPVLFIAVQEMQAQDILPICPQPDKHSVPAYSSREMKELMRFIPLEGVKMPVVFRNTQENCLSDPAGSLYPFWEKLTLLDRPVRIVHIGDSHIRGHVLAYEVRLLLESDFGAKAVEAIPVTYQTSGLAHETGSDGIVYHILGINGATCASFSTPENLRQVTDLQPDLVIFSFGTNEAHGRSYSPADHTAAMNRMVNELKRACPQAAFLLTTPPGAYIRQGRRGRVINPRTPAVVDNELQFARQKGMAVWNLYDIVGGKSRACFNWSAANMFQHDKIHFTHDGYKFQGRLLHEAIIKAYNDYVANRLD